MSSRPSAITAAGFVLSQATRQTSPSKRCPRATSSIESAITSRETRLARIPSVPIETPSETAIVLNSIGVPPASRIPRFTSCASSRWFRLHGIVSIQVVATPMIGLREVLVGEADALQHRPRAGAVGAVGDRGAVTLRGVGRLCSSRAILRAGSGWAVPRCIRLRSSRADLLDRLVGGLLAQLLQAAARPVFICSIQSCANEPSRMSESTLRMLSRTWSSITRGPRRQVAVLGRVGDREAHPGEAALVDQVDDQLQLVQALVVGDLRLVAGLDERLEPQRGRAR